MAGLQGPPLAGAEAHRNRFLIGRDRTGRWIVGDAKGRSGGIFADRDAAVRFAMSECECEACDLLTAPEGALSIDTLFDHDWPALRDRKLG